MNDSRLRNLGDIQYLAGRAYQPRPYSERVALFQATNRPVGPDWDQQFGWRKLAARLEVHEVPGHHESFFLEPDVEGLTNKLRRCLDEARAGAEGQKDEDHEI
jgi:thioesterase domain-containing protein